MKIVEALARFISSMMSPLLMPTYGVFLALWVTVLCYIPFGTRLMVLIVVAGITCLLPMVFIALLHNAKIIADKRLVNHRERWLPYIFTLACYVASVFYLRHVHSPAWMLAMMWGGVARHAHEHAFAGIGRIQPVWHNMRDDIAMRCGVHLAPDSRPTQFFADFGGICVRICRCSAYGEVVRVVSGLTAMLL